MSFSKFCNNTRILSSTFINYVTKLKISYDVSQSFYFISQVTIQFDQTNNVAPKTNVNLRVTADKDSVVNVLVYDRSVRLLKDGNDITRDRVGILTF